MMNNSKKKKASYNILTDNYVPASLPTYGQGLENFVTADYPMNRSEVVGSGYQEAEARLKEVVSTCDHYSDGTECDHYIDSAIEHSYAVHKSTIANNENQIARIHSAREMRKVALKRNIASLEERVTRLKTEIEPLEGLRSQFQLHIGRFAISIGLPITLAAMAADAAVNYSFLQSILLSNAKLLWITVICLSVMSDASMWALGTFLSHKEEDFISKPLFRMICIGLASMFVLSVVGSVMIRFGSMDATYGTVNAAGEFVGKDSYSLAEYGVTLITAFVTTATGLLSFSFSLDKNAYSVSVRDRKKKELAKCLAELEPLLNEYALLENAPDPQKWDERKRAAAVHQIEATRLGLKFHCRKLMAERINDPDFTGRMAKSGETLLENAAAPDTSTTITDLALSKVS